MGVCTRLSRKILHWPLSGLVGLFFCLFAALLSSSAAAQSAPPSANNASKSDGLQAFLKTLWPQAAARGISRATFDRALAGLTEDPSVPAAVGKQPEFERLLSSYFEEAVSPTRIARGRALAERYHSELAAIERRYGVPRAILLAAWGMESDFGRDRGDKDIVRSLATLAFRHQERDLFVNELLSALVILEKGAIPRGKLIGILGGRDGRPAISAFGLS